MRSMRRLSESAWLAWLVGAALMAALAWPLLQWLIQLTVIQVREDPLAARKLLVPSAVFLGLIMLVLAVAVRSIRGRFERWRLSLQQRAMLLRHAEELAQIGCAETDLMRDEVVWSAGMYRLLGVTPDDAQAPRRDWLEAHVPESERKLVRSISRAVTADAPCEFEHHLQGADGSLRTVLHRGMVEYDAKGWPRRMLTILQDVTAKREAELRIERLANSCEITGLPNRRALLDALDVRVRLQHGDAGQLALIDLAIEPLELVTQSFGFDVADQMLKEVARRLVQNLPDSALVAHLGRGEFAIMLTEGALDSVHAQGRAEDLRESLAVPLALGETELQISCAIGLTLSPRDGDQPQRLLQQAQSALSRARLSKGKRIESFDPATQANAAARLGLEAALRRALQRDEFSLCFQPQLDLHTGQICGAEALLRWQDPLRGAVSPADFIPLAEETGLIVEIGEWVLRKACQQCLEWQRAGLRMVRMSVNLSGRQLQQLDIAWRIQTILMETGLDPKHLSLEITESVLIDESAHMARVLNTLRAIGIELVLDDFGTGHSNLNCLRRLPIATLKIDRSIVHDITAGDQEVSMSRAVINLAHELKLKVLAEGVESEGQLALLMANRCDQMQGYYFSPAVPAAAFAAMLGAEKRLPEHLFGQKRERTLLLVDDEENILAALKRLLRRDGYRIVTAISGAQGLQRLAETQVDVIVSDQRMPGMTGVEFLRRAKDLCPDTVRMVLSGYTELQSITDAVNEGAIYKFLTKPWDDERLRAHISEAFRSKEMADENTRLASAVNDANQELALVNQRLEKALQKQRQKTSQEEANLQIVREVLEGIPAALIGVDTSGLLVYSNDAAEQLFGGDIGLLGQLASQALPDPLVALLEGVDECTRSLELRGRHFLASCRPMLDEQARGRGQLLVLTTIEHQHHEGVHHEPQAA